MGSILMKWLTAPVTITILGLVMIAVLVFHPGDVSAELFHKQVRRSLYHFHFHIALRPRSTFDVQNVMISLMIYDAYSVR